MILYPPENSIAFTILGLNIHWYGIIMSCAILIGVCISCYLFNKSNSSSELSKFTDVLPIVIIIAIIGARLFYVIGDWTFYSKNLTEIIMINHGGISIYGAIIFGVICLYICSKIYVFSIYKYCDIICIALPLSQAIGRWGNFINQEAYGQPYNGWLKMYIDKIHRYNNFSGIEYYHPAFLYESVLDIVLFLILLLIFKYYKKTKTGTIFYIYLISYSLIRLLVENIRIDSILNISGIHVASILGIVVIFFSLFGLKILYKK